VVFGAFGFVRDQLQQRGAQRERGDVEAAQRLRLRVARDGVEDIRRVGSEVVAAGE
jgi:hypothetical protein